MNGATVSVEANGERGEYRVAIALGPAVERIVETFEARLYRHAMPRQERHLRRAPGKTFERGKTMLGGELAD
jgi:hypothetical protein